MAPHDPRWPGYVQPTGYWFAREDPGWTPPADLVEFLTQGERPVAVSLGVMSGTGKRAEQGARIILQALRENKVRAVIQGWDERLRALETGGDIFYAGSLPHAWLFEQVSAVIHHGGFGTTAAVLRAGAPGIVIPHVIDQFYWGQQVRELGCGPQPIPRGKLTAEKLSAAIREALGSQGIACKAAELGAAIRGEPDGVARAVKLIEDI